MRVACETYVLLARFRDDTVREKKEEPPGSSFLISALTQTSMVWRRFVMMMVTPAAAVSAVVSIMRGGLTIGLRLATGRLRICLCT